MGVDVSENASVYTDNQRAIIKAKNINNDPHYFINCPLHKQLEEDLKWMKGLRSCEPK